MRVRVSRRAAVMGVGSLVMGGWEALRAGNVTEASWETVGTVAVAVAAALLHELEAGMCN